MNQDIRPVAADTPPLHEVAIGDVMGVLRAGWWQIAAVVAAMLLLSILYLQAAERRYLSSLVVTPVSGSAGLPSGIGGLASLAGINVPGSDADSQFELFVEGLTTRESAERLVRAHPDLLPRMFPGEWNAQRRQWQQPAGTVAGISRGIKSVLGMDSGYRPPDAARVQRWLSNELGVSKARDQRLTVISVETPDPDFGQKLLAALHETGDSLLRTRAVERADDYVAYLTGKLTEVTVADYRQTLVEALAEQEKTRMMASSNLPFAADPFGPPSTPDKPSSPNAILVLAVSIVFGLVIGVLLVLVRGRSRLFARQTSPG